VRVDIEELVVFVVLDVRQRVASLQAATALTLEARFRAGRERPTISAAAGQPAMRTTHERRQLYHPGGLTRSVYVTAPGPARGTKRRHRLGYVGKGEEISAPAGGTAVAPLISG
jgi:hypothetical protein